MSSKPKIAFCFLLYGTVLHRNIWEDFFSQDKNCTHTIYSHVKKITKNTPQWIRENKARTVKTGWCEENLIFAWVQMLKKAMKNKENKYFALLSGECIPLFTYPQTYKMITRSKKSRVNISTDVAIDAGDVYSLTGLLYADQWVILNRKCAQLMIDLKDSAEGKAWRKKTKKMMYLNAQGEPSCNYKIMSPSNECGYVEALCPDEIYPVNWLIHKLGRRSSKGFKKEIRDIPATYTYWDPESEEPHPEKFTYNKMKRYKRKICKSKAIFGRKFYPKAARKLALTCGN